MREVFDGWEAACRQKEPEMRNRCLNVLPGLVVGWLIPIGQGSAILFGGTPGIAAGYLLVYSLPGKKAQLWLTSSNQSKEQRLDQIIRE